MKDVRKTARFRDWLESVRDPSTRDRIEARIRRLAEGNPGHFRQLARGLRELKIDVGPGYRVYFVEFGRTVILLLAGGDKKSQQTDIAMAMRMLDEIREAER